MNKPINIYIRTSLIASLIGKSKYNDDHEAFTKLLEMNKNNNFTDSNDLYEINTLFNDKLQFKDDFQLVTNNYENIITLQNALKSIKHSPNITSILIEKCKKYMICNFGKIHENDVLMTYAKLHNIEFNTEKLFKSMKIFSCKYFNIIITGTPDAITSNNEIIEIKNRIHTFSKIIKDCDYIQLQMYLNLYEFDIGYLVEGMIYFNEQELIKTQNMNEKNIQLNTFIVKRDKIYFKQVINNIVRVSIIIYKLLDNEILYNKYIQKSAIQKSQFIYNHINKINNFIS